MATGKMIIEVYREIEGEVPPFSYIPCDLVNCMKRHDKASLKEIIERGFDDLPKRQQATDMRKEILERLDEANFDQISVAFNKPRRKDTDPYIELTNVMPATLAQSDARRSKDNGNVIILFGCYRLSDGNETTILKDGQRLTLIYSAQTEEETGAWMPGDNEDEAVVSEIRLNITYLQA